MQHIANPQTVIAEMARVVCPGGWVVAMDADWGTFVVDSDQHPLTRQLLNLWCDNFPSGWVGRQLLVWSRLKAIAYQTAKTVYQLKHGMLSDYLIEQLKNPSVQISLA